MRPGALHQRSRQLMHGPLWLALGANVQWRAFASACNLSFVPCMLLPHCALVTDAFFGNTLGTGHTLGAGYGL